MTEENNNNYDDNKNSRTQIFRAPLFFTAASVE
jgi:hypothetical protein